MTRIANLRPLALCALQNVNTQPALSQEGGDTEPSFGGRTSFLMVPDRPESRYSGDAYAATLVWGAAVILAVITLGVDLALLL